MVEESKRYVKDQLLPGFIPALTIAIPLAVAFLVFVSRMDTRITVIEQTAVTQQALEQSLRRVLKEELKPVLGSHEDRIRCLEIEVGRSTP